MNDKIVFAKTDAGQREIGERRAGLDPRQRRLLILVDGRRSVAELRALSGLGDLPAVLAELQSRGLVAAAGGAVPAAPAPGPGAGGTPAASAPDWRDRGRRAAHAVLELLGPMAEMLAVQLEAPKSPEALELLLTRSREMVEAVRGKAALERFEQMLTS
jgi:hypothetical protein